MTMNRNVMLLSLCCLILLAGCGKIESGPTQITKTFGWTATGDDGVVGTAASYALKYARTSDSLTNQWNRCTEVLGLPTPKIAGSVETFTTTMTLETGVTYYFGLKAVDETGNWSLLSNVISLTPPDIDPPLGIGDLHWIN